MTHSAGQTSLPWYKQFWPWFLIALPATVVVASLYTVYIAFTNIDPVVADNYYKEGLAINRVVADIERAREAGITATLMMDGAHLTLVLGNASPEALHLEIRHPLDSSKDINLVLDRQVEGDQVFYAANLPATMVYGRYYFDVYTQGDMPWRLKGEQMFPLKQIQLGKASG